VAPDDLARHRVRLDSLPRKVRAKVAMDDAGPAIADEITTAMAVFDRFHSVSGTIIELTDGARVPVLDSMSRTMFATLNRRDKAIADVYALRPPAPPVPDLARAAQEDAAPTFDTTMPTIPVWLDDETQHIDGLLADATDLRPGGKRILTKGRAQIVKTETKVNTLWPPVIDD
jgi:hypothetical protein